MSSNEQEYLARLREALVMLRKVRSERDDLLKEKFEPIAVIGLACRFPGGGNDPEGYWQALIDGVDAIREVVPERFSSDLLPEDKPAAHYAALLDGLDRFDAA